MRPRHRVALIAEIATAWIPLAWALHRRSLPELLASARRPRVRAIVVPEAERLEVAVRLGAIVDRVVGRFPLENRCLVRSLVLIRLLARRSIPDAVLIIGAQVDGGFAAHAWVEYAGQALLPPFSHEPLTRL